MVTKLDLRIGGGDPLVDRDQVARVKTPEPQGSWFPIGHGQLLAQVEGTLKRSGLEVVNEAHVLAHEGDRYFGLLQVMDRKLEGGDYSLVIGLRNSHDKSIVAGLAVGAGVHVCSNLSFSSEVKIERKHTRYCGRDLPTLVESAVGRLGDLRHAQDDRILAYKKQGMTDERAHDIVIQAYDARIVPVTRLPALLKEWREPQHPEFKEKNAWRLFNAFTETLKESSLFGRPVATQALHGIMDTACGLSPVGTEN